MSRATPVWFEMQHHEPDVQSVSQSVRGLFCRKDTV